MQAVSDAFPFTNYYNLLSVCAGENQGRNPIGKALVGQKT